MQRGVQNVSEIAELETRFREHPTDVTLLMRLADSYLVARQFDEAVRAYTGAAALDPDLAAAFYGAGRVMVEKKDYRAAVPLLSAAAGKSRNNVRYWIDLGLAFEKVPQLHNAAACFEAAEALDPARDETKLHLLRIRFKLGFLEQIVSTTEAGNSLSSLIPKYPDVLLTRANALLILGRQDEAKAAIGQALKLFPDSVDVRAAAASHASMAGDLNTAHRLLDEASREAPDNYWVLIGQGTVALQEENLSAAKDRFLHAWKDGEGGWEACLGLASIAYRQSDGASLDKWTEQGCALAPWHPGLLDLRGRLMAGRGDLAKAEECFRQAIKVNPFAQAAHFDLAKLLWSKGLREQAREQLEKVVAIAADNELGRAASAQLQSFR